MVVERTASIIPLHQPRRPKTGAERQRAYRQRKQQQREAAPADDLPDIPADVLPNDLPVTSTVASPVTTSVTPVTVSHCHVTGGRPISSQALTAAALALGGVGVTMNGWFARSLGSTDLAGWLFLAV